MKATFLPLEIDFSRWFNRNGERSATNPPVSKLEGKPKMHFRVLDLAAERCVWSVPPIDTVPLKLRTQKLVVRCVDNDGEVVDVVPVDGLKLQELATQLLADRRMARLNIHLAIDDSYAGRVMRLDLQ